MASKIFIVHFHPISIYPPVLNLINFLIEKGEKIKVSTAGIDVQADNIRNKNLEINYLFKRKRIGGFLNTLKFIYFNIHTFFSIIKFKPSFIIYYESVSALPAIFYKKYINKHVKIICHYHEISSNETISEEARSVKLIRSVEKKNYKNFSWISQTNELRKNIFINDYANFIDHSTIHTLANYPPKEWTRSKYLRSNNKVRFVLVGSIDVNKMHLKEFCNLLEKQDFEYTFDIYTLQTDELTKTFIKSKKYINLRNFIQYETIPAVLKNYDIGVILYKPISINIINCASNKLFEYHVCGLDVIFPSSMTYSKKYITNGTFPIINEIHFQNIENIDLRKLLDKTNLEYNLLPFTADDEYEKLYTFLKDESIS